MWSRREEKLAGPPGRQAPARPMGRTEPAEDRKTEAYQKEIVIPAGTDQLPVAPVPTGRSAGLPG